VLCLCCAAWRWTRWWRWPSFCWPRYESLGWVTLRQSVNPWPPIYLLHDPISSSSCCRLVHLLLLLLHCAGAAWAYFHNQQEESAGCMGILSHTHLLLLLLHCAGAAVEGRLHGGGHAGGGGPAASCCKVSPPLPCPYLHSSLCSRSWPLFPFAATGRRHVPTSHPSACPFCCVVTPFAATGRRHVPTSHPSACPFCQLSVLCGLSVCCVLGCQLWDVCCVLCDEDYLQYMKTTCR
jgi:hypothetical protein